MLYLYFILFLILILPLFFDSSVFDFFCVILCYCSVCVLFFYICMFFYVHFSICDLKGMVLMHRLIVGGSSFYMFVTVLYIINFSVFWQAHFAAVVDTSGIDPFVVYFGGLFCHVFWFCVKYFCCVSWFLCVLADAVFNIF